LAAEMRASERRPGKLTLLRGRRKEDYGVYVLGPQEEERLDWEVRSKGRSYWANCAWGMLGIPAALHSDADVEAEYAEDGSPARSGGHDLTTSVLSGAAGPCLACDYHRGSSVTQRGMSDGR
jgi:hypothetical protein